jgi:mono/diheme cytochrome c family protein
MRNLEFGMRAFAGFAVFAFLIASAAAAERLQPSDAVARRLQPGGSGAENGKRLFMTYYCYSCHGTEGHGGAGPRLIARATPDALIRYVRKPTGGNMPPYTTKVISDQDLIDIHAYLRSVPPSPQAKSLPLLQQ